MENIKIMNVKTGIVVGEVIGRNLVKTVFGDIYEVAENEIEWLLDRAMAGKIHVLDIKFEYYSIDFH